MAIVISAGAGLMLGRLGGTMVDLSGRDIPRLAASLQLSAQSTSLASQGPALLASRTEEALNDRTEEDEGNPDDRAAEARRDRRARRRQGGRRGAHRERQEHRRHDQEPGLGRARAARTRRPSTRNCTTRCARRRRRFVAAAGPAAMDAQTELQSIYAAAQLLAGRRHQGHTGPRTNSATSPPAATDRVRHDRRTVDQQRRNAGGHRARISAPRRRA